MGKRVKYKQTLEKNQSWIKAGRGSWTRAKYIPWRRVHEENYPGTTLRIPDPETGRLHQVFGSGHIGYLYMCLFDDDITDIREYVPLLPVMWTSETESLRSLADTDFMSEIREISKELQIRQPRYSSTNEVKIILQDFLLTHTDDTLEAVSVISEDSLHSPALKHIHMIQEEYWRRQGIPFTTKTKESINKIRVANIRFILHGNRADIDKISQAAITYFLDRYSDTSLTINEIARDCESRYGLPPGMGINIFSYILRKKIISIDIDTSPINLNAPRKEFPICR